MGTRIIISCVFAFLLAVAGKHDDATPAAPSVNEVSAELHACTPSGETDAYSTPYTAINPLGVPSPGTGISLKLVKHLVTRHIHHAPKTLATFHIGDTHQKSDLTGTIQFLVALEKLLI